MERDRPSGVVLVEATRLSKVADVLLLQECNGYLDALRKVPGFVPVAFDQEREQHESLILHRAGLPVSNQRAVRVTSAGWTTSSGGHTPPKWATGVDVAGVSFWSLHTPPSQQPVAKRLVTRARARAYDELMSNLPVSDRCVIGGDWNVTPTGRGAASFPARSFPRLGLALYAPTAGTHGSRTIDYFGARGVKVTDVRAFSGTWGSDHEPVVATITL